jgi:hypothetical protein
VPAAVVLVGSYDVSITRNSATVASVGAVYVHDDQTTVVLTDPPMSLDGSLNRDGTIALEGLTTFSDAISFVNGTARAELSSGTLRITGTLDERDTFVMVRNVGVDQRGQSGRYRIRFRPSPQTPAVDGTVDVTLVIDSAGQSDFHADPERDADGTPIATFGLPRFLIAPSGRFHIAAQYFPIVARCVFDPCQIEVTGELPATASDVPGNGEYRHLNGLFMFQSGGDVEVTRLGALP